MSEHYYCAKCGKNISMQEATDSSIALFRKFGNDECYNHDFCSICARSFETEKDFLDFIKAFDADYFVETKKG